MNLRHRTCGAEVTIAAVTNDVALYVWCDRCRDIVEDGELDPPIDESRVRLRVVHERVRLMDGAH